MLLVIVVLLLAIAFKVEEESEVVLSTLGAVVLKFRLEKLVESGEVAGRMTELPGALERYCCGESRI